VEEVRQQPRPETVMQQRCGLQHKEAVAAFVVVAAARRPVAVHLTRLLLEQRWTSSEVV